MADRHELHRNIDRLHTTKLGADRVKDNLGLQADDVLIWCRQKIEQADRIVGQGKNWYVYTDDAVITVNAHSYTIITAHHVTATEMPSEQASERDLQEAMDALLSMIHKLEKSQDKLKEGTPQWTTLVRRLRALRLALVLMARECEQHEIVGRTQGG